MIRLHMIKEIEKSRRSNCNPKILKILEDKFEQCLKKNNNKANYCQEERYKYEKCHNFLKFVNNKII